MKPIRAAALAARPWVIRTALGPPVEPEVKMRRKSWSGVGSDRGTAGASRYLP